MTPAELEAVPPVTVERESLVDPRGWDDLVQLLAALLYPAAPDESDRR